MPLGVFNKFFRSRREEPLGLKLASIYELKAQVQSSGFQGSTISRNWRDLVEAEERLKDQMAKRHWAALELTEKGDRAGGIERHRANYEDLFHVADTYEILSMHAQGEGRLDEAIEIMERGIMVFEELVEAGAPNRENAIRFMRRRMERLRAKQEAAAGNSRG